MGLTPLDLFNDILIDCTYQVNAQVEVVVKVIGDVIALLAQVNLHLIFGLKVCAIGAADFGEDVLAEIAEFDHFGELLLFPCSFVLFNRLFN